MSQMSSDVFNNLVNVTEYLSQMSSNLFSDVFNLFTWLTVTEYLSQMSSDVFNVFNICHLVNRYGISVTNVLECIQ